MNKQTALLNLKCSTSCGTSKNVRIESTDNLIAQKTTSFCNAWSLGSYWRSFASLKNTSRGEQTLSLSSVRNQSLPLSKITLLLRKYDRFRKPTWLWLSTVPFVRSSVLLCHHECPPTHLGVFSSILSASSRHVLRLVVYEIIILPRRTISASTAECARIYCQNVFSQP